MKTSAWKVCSTAYRRIVRKALFTSERFRIKDIANHLTKGWSEREKRIAHPDR
jgi:hypothetical protein